MKKGSSQIICGLVFSLSLFSYSSNKIVTDFTQIISNRFAKQWIYSPHEKIYIQTDKPYYSDGEDIWFKGYLVNATTHEFNSLSQFI